MTNKSFFFSGPLIVYTTAMLTMFSMYLLFSGYIAFPSAEVTDNSRYWLRVSGRTGMFLLLVSFCASPLHRLFKAAWTAYLIKNRRYYGISTAIVLWSHFSVILSLQFTDPKWFEVSVPWFILWPGSITFTLVGIMALISNSYCQKKLGMKAWKTIHLLGGYSAAASFIGEYILVLYLQPILLPDYDFGKENDMLMVYSLFAVALLIVLLRLSAIYKRRLT